MVICMNLIIAPGSVSDDPGSVMWFANQAVEISILSVGESILKNYTSLAAKLECTNTFCCDIILLKLLASDWELESNAVKVLTGTKIAHSPPLDSWIDNLDMVIDFIHFICQFWSSMTILPVWTSQQTLSTWPHSKCWETSLPFDGASFWPQ